LEKIHEKQLLFVMLLIGAVSLHAQQNNSSQYTTALGVKIYPGQSV